MIRRIKLHNYLNGLWFSLFEYLIVATVLTPFLVIYVGHGWTLYALAAGGVILNCLTMCGFAIESIRRREQSIGLVRFARDTELRKRVAVDHPHLSHDTLVLSVTVLIPFWICVAVLLDGRIGASKP